MLSIIMQEKDPWNLTYTIVPCVACVFLSIILRIRQRKHIAVHYNMKELRMGGIALLVGLYFFIVGLNEKTDYLRINHGIWHLQAAIFSYYFLNAVRTVPINQEKRTDKD